jgi:hypothetical protein
MVSWQSLSLKHIYRPHASFSFSLPVIFLLPPPVRMSEAPVQLDVQDGWDGTTRDRKLSVSAVYFTKEIYNENNDVDEAYEANAFVRAALRFPCTIIMVTMVAVLLAVTLSPVPNTMHFASFTPG